MNRKGEEREEETTLRAVRCALCDVHCALCGICGALCAVRCVGYAVWGMLCAMRVLIQVLLRSPSSSRYEGGKSKKALARNEQTTAKLIQWINEFTGHTT